METYTGPFIYWSSALVSSEEALRVTAWMWSRIAKQNKERGWLSSHTNQREMNMQPSLQRHKHTGNHPQHEWTAHRWFFLRAPTRRGEPDWRETEAEVDVDDVRLCCRAHTGRERGNRKSNGFFLITFLLNGISEEGIRMDALSHRKLSGRSGKCS